MNHAQTNKQKNESTAIWASLNGYLGLLMVTVAFDKSDRLCKFRITVATVDELCYKKFNLFLAVA
jgi:hypothetical protein